mgnify:CR=1 FL=1
MHSISLLLVDFHTGTGIPLRIHPVAEGLEYLLVGAAIRPWVPVGFGFLEFDNKVVEEVCVDLLFRSWVAIVKLAVEPHQLGEEDDKADCYMGCEVFAECSAEVQT